jgi:hypothetical protein
MSRADRIGLLLSLIGTLVAYVVTERVFEAMPHIEDEMAYVWQADTIAIGHLTLPSPPDPKSFLVPFVVEDNGQRFGKYPLGWPALLAVAVKLGARSWVNPLLAGLGVWFTYRLGKRIFGETVGLLAAGLTVASPFFMMNSGTLLSHPLGLVLSGAFALAWLDAFWTPSSSSERNYSPWLPTVTAAFSLGLLALTRPLTAVGVGLPFGLHGIYLLARGDWPVRRRLLAFGLITLAIACLFFVWQYAVTGDPFFNPYTLWWSYDKIGFGPGIGVTSHGHNLTMAEINTRFSLWVGEFDLFGWGRFSWIFLPIGLLALLPERKTGAKFNGPGLLVGAVFLSLVLVYAAYWIGSYLFGPRYYYEGLFSLTLFSAAGIAYLAGWPTRPGAAWKTYQGWDKARPLAMTAILALLVFTNLYFYTPLRVGGMHGLYGIQRSRLEPFSNPKALELTPALIIVIPDAWTGYGALLELENPLLNTPFIFAFTRGPDLDQKLATYFPDRKVFYYYPDAAPYSFYTAPLAQP